MFTIIGSVLGLIFGGFSGAFGGFLIGLLLDSITFGKKVRVTTHHYHQEDFTDHILILAAYIAKADQNRLLRSEMMYVHSYLERSLSPDKVAAAMLRFRDILNENTNITPVCDYLRMNATIYEKLMILQFLFGFATADGEIRDDEIEALQYISDLCGISRSSFESLKSMYMNYHQGGYYNTGYNRSQESYQSSSRAFISQDTLENDYKILEITPNATDDEVKKAYRTAAKKHHPDKVNHLGEEVRKAAEIKFAQVNEAYEHIKKSRNIK